MPEDQLVAIADELYALPLGEFTPARDARAKELKADRELAARVKALRKPSTAAWVANLLVRRDAGQVDQVLAVGEALREAQAGLQGDELRTLTRQRRQLTAAVTTRARGLAAEHGLKVTESVAEQVEATLTAAMVDPEAAQALRTGLLVAALTSTGFGGVDLDAALALPDAAGHIAAPIAEPEPPGRPELRVVPQPEPDERARAEARDRVEAAASASAAAARAAVAAAEQVADLQASRLQHMAELDELRRSVAALEDRVDEVDEKLAGAEAERDRASEARTAAEQEHADAEAALAALAVPGEPPG